MSRTRWHIAESGELDAPGFEQAAQEALHLAPARRARTSPAPRSRTTPSWRKQTSSATSRAKLISRVALSIVSHRG
jgi:hypothetical protein